MAGKCKGATPAGVVIIGAGFSGTLLAIHLLRGSDAGIVLLDHRARFARGVAYSTTAPEHRLNVPAGNMSAFADRPDDFAGWLQAQDAGDGDSFASRGCYGDYLAALLDEAEQAQPGRLRRCRGTATALWRRPDGYDVELDDGGRLAASHVVLALGNLPALDPPGVSRDALPPELYVADPWAEDFTAGLTDGDAVAVIGTGLTMVDVVLRLASAGFDGPVTAISRRGLLPRAHEAPVHAPLSTGAGEIAPVDRLSRMLRALRRRGDEIGWREAVDELRPHTQALWSQAPADMRGRFLRHLRAWWDVHRHRLAPVVAERLEGLLHGGGVRVEAGRLAGHARVADGVELRWQPRGGGPERRRRFRRIINCTGPQSDLSRTSEPLLRHLVAAGLVRPDAQRLGIDVTVEAKVLDAQGRADPRLSVVGPLSRGALWEIVAVPDIRVQVASMARRIALGADARYSRAPADDGLAPVGR